MSNYLRVLFLILISGVLTYSQTFVSPGDGTLLAAIEAASDGDVLLLVPGAEYTETDNYDFGDLAINLTITVDGDETSDKPVIKMLKASDGESTPSYFSLINGGAITLKGIEFDGSQNGVASANHLVDFVMEGTLPTDQRNARVEVDNCYVHDLEGHVIHAGSSDLSGYLIVDTVIVKNTVMRNTGTAVYLKYAGCDYVSMTNSTFADINSYGVRIAGPGYTNLADHTPTVVVDKTTWYNIGTSDGREILLLEKGPNLNTWTVTNSIFVKQVNKSKTVINLKETTNDQLATITNFLLWDVGARVWRDHTVSDSINVDPNFADPDNGDFTLPEGSELYTFASDGGAIGDPRWAKYPVGVKENDVIPVKLSLSQNYPNPFNPTTVINYSIPQTGFVSMKVYNILGVEVAELVNNTKSAGNYSVDFNASNLSSGIYFYTLQYNNTKLTNKMILIK